MKLHPWFAGVDWPSLARQKVAFVPQPDCDTDTSYFSSKPVSQRSLALDLDSSRSDLLEAAAGVAGVVGAPLSPGAASLASSRSHSRVGSKRTSTRRRSLRQALAEPSAASFSELRGLRGGTRSHSSGASTTSRASPSRASLTGPPDGAVQPSAGSVVRAAAALLQRQQAAGGQHAQQLQQVQLPTGALARRSTVLSAASGDLPAGEALAGLGGYGSAPLSGDEDEQLAAAAAAAFGSRIDGAPGLGSGDGGDTEMVEVDDAASLSGSSAGSALGSGASYASGSGSALGSGCGASGASSGSGLELEQSLEALRWVGCGALQLLFLADGTGLLKLAQRSIPHPADRAPPIPSSSFLFFPPTQSPPLHPPKQGPVRGGVQRV